MSAPSTTEVVQSCANCGASIYPEHLHRGLAQWQAGRLLCQCCAQELAAEAPEEDDGTDIPIPPIEFVPDAPGDTSTPAMASPSPASAVLQGDTTRSVGKGARHVKTFHAKLSEGAVQNMDALVNEWLARHPEVEIKFVNTTVGTWEGKHAEPNLIYSIFY